MRIVGYCEEAEKSDKRTKINHIKSSICHCTEQNLVERLVYGPRRNHYIVVVIWIVNVRIEPGVSTRVRVTVSWGHALPYFAREMLHSLCLIITILRHQRPWRR